MTLAASASRFAHLVLGKPARAAAPSDDDENGREEEAAAAETEEGDEPGDDDEDEGKVGKKSKKAKKAKQAEDDFEDEEARAEGDDDNKDDDDKDDAKKAQAKGRRIERKRCAVIFSHSAASRNIPLACSLAFETNMAANAVIAILEAQPAAKQGLADRMAGSGAGNTRVAPSPPEAPKGKAAIAASWDRAMKSVAPNRAA